MAPEERPHLNPAKPTSHLERLASEVIEVALWIHRGLGPGLLESVYARLLALGLQRKGRTVHREKRVGFEFGGLSFSGGLRVDLLVDHMLVVEVKAEKKLHPVYRRQVLTYLRATKLPLGLLINFGGRTLKEGGIYRVVNDLRRNDPGQAGSSG